MYETMGPAQSHPIPGYSHAVLCLPHAIDFGEYRPNRLLPGVPKVERWGYVSLRST
jgi:hypothetical protein